MEFYMEGGKKGKKKKQNKNEEDQGMMEHPFNVSTRGDGAVR